MSTAVGGGRGQADIWSIISEANKKAEAELPPPYVHPLLKRSSSFLSQKSLEVCTENLGSETGSDGFSDLEHCLHSPPDDTEYQSYESSDTPNLAEVRKGLSVVNYHFSRSRRSPPRSFPPPLPSISRRDGPCFNMRTHRQDDRLVLQAVPVPSKNYLHCERQNGRLLLSFIDTTFEEIYLEIDRDSSKVQTEEVAAEEMAADEEDEEEIDAGMELEDVHEEVEVVDRGIVVEVKVSRQPQALSRGVVHRSSLVINKFVSGTPVGIGVREKGEGRGDEVEEGKVFISSKGKVKRQELLYQVRRCSETRSRPIFIWEPCCIATS